MASSQAVDRSDRITATSCARVRASSACGGRGPTGGDGYPDEDPCLPRPRPGPPPAPTQEEVAMCRNRRIACSLLGALAVAASLTACCTSYGPKPYPP